MDFYIYLLVILNLVAFWFEVATLSSLEPVKTFSLLAPVKVSPAPGAPLHLFLSN